MRDACARHGVPLPAAALQFPLRNPAVTAAVVGARSPEEVTADVAYLSTRIPDALWSELAVLLTTGLLPGRCEFLAQVSAAASAHASYS
jgi:D-threo-aldose 1-dehydrogenase